MTDVKEKWDYIDFTDGAWKSNNTNIKSGIGGYIINKHDDICFIFSGPTIVATSLEAETKAFMFLLNKLTVSLPENNHSYGLILRDINLA